MIGFAGPSDGLALPLGRYTTNIGWLSGWREVAGRTQVSPVLTPGEKTAVIIIWGQSNAASHGAGLYSFASTKVHNLSIDTGGMYRAQEPLLGNSYLLTDPTNGGCYASRLGDKLIAQGYCARVILVSVAIGGTFMSQWAQGGDCNERLAAAIRRLAALGLAADAILVTQGENDYNTTHAGLYAAALASAVATLRSEGCRAPVVVTQTSQPGSALDNVLMGQAKACNGIDVIQGPATNGFSRRDGIHFDIAGLEAVANALVPYVAPLIH